MKFNVSSQDFLHQLNKAAGAISSNPVLPVLEDFLFVVKGNALTITATNLETTIITDVEVSVEEEGMAAVPARILLDTLKALPDQPITIAIDEDSRGVTITSAYGKYKLTGDNPEDFPEIQEVNTESALEIDGGTMIKALTNTLFATSNDDLRIAMTGVYIQVDFNKITFVATDAHKLVKFTHSGISTEHTGSFIVPKKSLSLLKGILHDDTEVTLQHGKSNVSFTLDGAQMVCRLIDANYPDYNAVIPTENPNTLRVSRTDFLNSLKRIAIYANKTTNQVVLNMQDGSLTVSAQDLDFSNEATEQLSCDYDGESLVIGFNGKFLIEMLTVLETDEVQFELSSPNRAGIMLPGEEEENEDLLMLVMPVMMGT